MEGRKKGPSENIRERVRIVEAMQARNADRQKELERREEQLRHRTNEFIAKQVDVHQKSRGMVSALDVIEDQSSEEQKPIVEAFKKPYVILTANPFPLESSGDVNKDLHAIFDVIERRDEQLQLFFASTMQSAANFMPFNDFLAKIRNDERLAAIMRECVQAKTWLDVETCAALPYQNACRYKLLIDAIKRDLLAKRNLTNPGPGHLDDLALIDRLLSQIENSEVRIQAELAHINDHKDTLVLLNEAYYYLMAIERRAEVRASEYKSPTGLSLKDLVAQAKFFIPVVSAKVAANKPRFIQEIRGVLDTLELMRPALQELIAAEQNTYKTQSFNMLNRVVDRFVDESLAYDPLAGDPRAMLLSVMSDLAYRVERIEAKQLDVAADDTVVMLEELSAAIQAMSVMPAMRQLGFKSDNNLTLDVLVEQGQLYIREFIREYQSIEHSEDFDPRLYLDTMFHLLKPLEQAVKQSLAAQPTSYLGWIVSGVASYAGSLFSKQQEDPRELFQKKYADLENKIRVLVIQNLANTNN